MNDTHAERICQALERIAAELQTMNDIGVVIWTAYEQPVEVKGLITVKEH